MLEGTTAKVRRRSATSIISHRLLSHETLERRDLLSCSPGGVSVPAGEISGDITQNQIWDDTSAPYVIAGSVDVENAATLHIMPGVVVQAEDENSMLAIAGIGQGACLAADAAEFSVEVNFGDLATAELTGNTIDAEWIINSRSLLFELHDNHFNSAPIVHAESVSVLVDNSFAPGSVVRVQYNITRDIEWPAIPDVTQYQIRNDVNVESGATLTIADGVRVGSLNSASELVVAADDGFGRLVANQVDFLGEVILTPTARAEISNSHFYGQITVQAANSNFLSLSDNTFHVGPIVHPSFPPHLAASTFDAGTTILLLGGDIEADVTWPAYPNVSAYRLRSDVDVRSFATLTVEPGLALQQESTAAELIVWNGAGLIAEDTDIFSEVLLGESAEGSIDGSAVYVPIQIAVRQQSQFSVSGVEFFANPLVHGNFVPRLTESASFQSASIGILAGTIDTPTTWPALPGTAGYVLWSDVLVEDRLEIASGVVVGRQSNDDDITVIGGQLVADNVEFLANVAFSQSGQGELTDCQFFAGLIVDVENVSQLLLTNATFFSSPNVTAEFVPELASQSFVGALYVRLRESVIDRPLHWAAIDDTLGYQFTNDVTVISGGSLSLEPGVFLRQLSGDLEIHDGGVLLADNVDFYLPVYVRDGGWASLTNSRFAGFASFDGTVQPLLQGNSFTQAPSVAASSVDALLGNSLLANSVSIIGDDLEVDAVWPLIDGVDYNLTGTISVSDGATLTIEPGVTVSQAAGLRLLQVSSDNSYAQLMADGVQFEVEVRLKETAGGRITNNVFRASPEIEGTGLGMVFEGNLLEASARVSATFVPYLENNVFPPNSTVEIFSGSVEEEVTWPKIPNISAYELPTIVRVENGGSLILAPEIRLIAPSVNQGFRIYTQSTFIADNVDFTGLIDFRSGSNGVLTDSDVSGRLEIDGDANVSIDDNAIVGFRPYRWSPAFRIGRQSIWAGDPDRTIGKLHYRGCHLALSPRRGRADPPLRFSRFARRHANDHAGRQALEHWSDSQHWEQ